MKKYKYVLLQEEIDEKIDSLIARLRDESFGSESQRKALIDILTSMHNSKDKRARVAFKKIGHLFTDIGDELLKIGQEEEEE